MSAPPAGLDLAEYEALLRADLAGFAERAFCELYPQTDFLANWHQRVIAAKLVAVYQGRIRRLIINVPPRHLKSHLVSVTFPAWCLGHRPSLQFLCVSYAQDLADKLSRDCRRIMTSDWYQRLFATRLAPRHQAVSEFETTRQGCRLATSVGGVPTGRGADMIIIDDPLKPEEALSQAQRRAANEWFDHTLYSRLNDKHDGAIIVIRHQVMENRGFPRETRSYSRIRVHPALSASTCFNRLQSALCIPDASGGYVRRGCFNVPQSALK
jgi:hypothetical protein